MVPPEPLLRRSPDQGRDHLIALAVAAGAVLVSGDRHLPELDEALPLRSAAAFLALLGDGS